MKKSSMCIVFLAYDTTLFLTELTQLAKIGIEVFPVASVDEVLNLVTGGKVEGVILGFFEAYTTQLLKILKSNQLGNIPILVLLSAEHHAIEGDILSSGADYVVVAPWNVDGVCIRVERMCRDYLDIVKLDESNWVVDFLTLTVGKYDGITAQHIKRIQSLSGQVALQMGLMPREVTIIRAGGLLHDIGKILIPKSILQKTGPLNDQEWAIMKLHPEYGADLVAKFPTGSILAPIVRSHHERWDGSGYPDGLSYKSIPLGGRIVAAVDAFDAMTTHRPYRTGLHVNEAIARLIHGSGSQFDPDVILAFLSILSN
jgi:putative two-component system response regulator